MLKTNLILKSLLFCLLGLIFPFCFVSGLQLQLNYPSLPGIGAPNTDFLTFLRYVYQTLLGMGALLALIIFIYGGLRYLTSFSENKKLSGAKNMMTSAVLGLFILFGSYTILSTIDPGLVVFNIRIFDFELQKQNVNPLTPPDSPPGCFILPMTDLLTQIHRLEKEGIDITERLEPLINGSDNPQITGAFPALEDVYETLEQCRCDVFTAECLTPGGESWHCPAWCPPDQPGEPCPPELPQQVQELRNELSNNQEIIDLLRGFGFDISDDIEEEIIKVLDEGFPDRDIKLKDFVQKFFRFVEEEKKLGTMNDDQKTQLRKLLETSPSVLQNILDSIIRKLTEILLNFDKNMVKASQCRQDWERTLMICSSAKDAGFKGECQELDFFCCP